MYFMLYYVQFTSLIKITYSSLWQVNYLFCHKAC